MAYANGGLGADVVSGEQYRYALQNFRVAHEKVEEQRRQLLEQENQVALLRARITTLEGGNLSQQSYAKGGSSVDDFSIKNAASKLERLINRWAADLIRNPPASLDDIYRASLIDLQGDLDTYRPQPSPIMTQSLLRHAMSEAISEGIINSLVVTNSAEANAHLTRIHDNIFARDPVVACVWRRQTFSAAVDLYSDMTKTVLDEHLPTVTKILAPSGDVSAAAGTEIIQGAYEFSRMLHGSNSTSGGTVDAFYRAFVPELGSTLYPRQIELIKRCLRSERGEQDTVGAVLFPGLVKVTRGPMTPSGQSAENVQTVVRRAQVICDCALIASAG